jgi:hypothetical protein
VTSQREFDACPKGRLALCASKGVASGAQSPWTDGHAHRFLAALPRTSSVRSWAPIVIRDHVVGLETRRNSVIGSRRPEIWFLIEAALRAWPIVLPVRTLQGHDGAGCRNELKP